MQVYGPHRVRQHTGPDEAQQNAGNKDLEQSAHPVKIGNGCLMQLLTGQSLVKLARHLSIYVLNCDPVRIFRPILNQSDRRGTARGISRFSTIRQPLPWAGMRQDSCNTGGQR